MRNNKDKIIQLYFIDKYRPVDIAKELKISKSAVTQVLKQDTRYSKEKAVRHANNRIKHVEKTKETIKNKRAINQFNNNVDDLVLRKLHNEASVELSKGKRLNNMAYRDWNKSAYKYNSSKHRFEFKDELGRSFDVPKYIKVEV